MNQDFINSFHHGYASDAYNYLGSFYNEKETTFRVYAPHATTISVVGDFNHWDISKNPMFASKYVRFVLGMKIHDTTAGFKCYRREVLETIELDKIRFKGYAFQIEMKFTAYKCGFNLVEVPIIFINRVLGTSKMSGGIFSEALLGVIRLKISSWTRKYPMKKIEING